MSILANLLAPYVGLADDGLKFGTALVNYLNTKLLHDIADEIETLEDERKAALDRGNPDDLMRADILTGIIERKIAERNRIPGSGDVPIKSRPGV